jgi:predicted NAD-dependent protein-ADP-ribosyltransferase YbiA (DUF1768 family)
MIMKSGVRLKFMQNGLLQAKLLGNGDAYLAEASPVDRYWGIGLRDGA